jgi:hypothetical protein
MRIKKVKIVAAVLSFKVGKKLPMSTDAVSGKSSRLLLNEESLLGGGRIDVSIPGRNQCPLSLKQGCISVLRISAA